MEGMTYLEHPRRICDLTSIGKFLNRKPTLNQVTNVTFVDTDASDEVNTDLPESLTPMSKLLTALAWPCVNSSLLPTVKPEVVNRMKDSYEVNMTLPESSAPTIDSNLSMKNWEDGVCRLLIYASDVSQEVLKTNSPNPEVANIQNAAEEI